MIFATFDTSISSSVFLLRALSFRSFLVIFCLTWDCGVLELHLERHPLRQRCQHFERHLLQRHCQHLQHHSLQWRRCDLHCWSSRDLLVCRRTGAWFVWRPARLPCSVCGVQPLPAVVGPSLFLEGVLPFLHGISLSDLVLVCLLALLRTQDTPGSSRARRSPTVSGTLFSTVLLQQVGWEGGLRQVRGCDHAALPWAELPPLAGVKVGPMARLVC